ncbi:MAG: ABC transporter substrate-binding protein [Arcobacteraceae bacterium]|nr:ABC transporter substrate-binding protein [Arcobacteraceae bacterium]
MTKKLLLLFILISTLFASQKDKVSVQLLWKHQFEFAGFYMAKKMGFYDEAKLEVELKEYTFGTNITKDVENEVSTFGVAYPNLILDKSKGANVIVLNALYQTSPHILVTLEKSSIKSIKDFKNKTIMIEDDAIKNAPLLSMLHSQNISLTDVKLINPSFNVDDLINGKVDVFSAYRSNELYKLDDLGIKYRVFDPKDYGFDFYNDLLFTSQKLAQNNPELVSRFQKATLKGYEYAFSHINETIAEIEEHYNTQKKSYKALQFESKILKELAYENGAYFGNVEKGKLKRIQDIYGLMGLMNKDIQFPEFVFDINKVYLSKEEQEFLKNKIFTISVAKDCRPFSFQKKDSSPGGISAEYWELIEKELGIQVQYQFDDTFTQQLDAIKHKTADIIYSTGKTKDKEAYSIFTDEYTTVPISIATQKNQDFIENFKEIINKKIAVGKNFTAHKLLSEKYPNINFVLVENIDEGLALVQKGEVFGFVDMKPALSYNIKRLQYDNIKIAGNTGIDFKVSIMIRDDYPLLQSALNKAIRSINNEKINNILKKYDNVEFEKSADYTIFYTILLVVAMVLLLLLFKQYILNKANKNLKLIVDEKTKTLKELNETLEFRIQEAIEENKSKDIILLQQSKMASMGEMIGNIAHQWRQPLSVISTSVTGLHFKIEYGLELKEKEILETMDRVNETTQFLSKTIDDFQDYLKPTNYNEEFNIKDVITKNLEMFGKSFSNNDIEIIASIEDILLLNNQNELLQVTINILNNAKDALKEFRNEDRLLFISTYKQHNFAIISIKDNAGGISQEVLPKIFDAYFTTKHKSQGTGLGLYMSYQIIKNRFKGNIEVINEEYEYEGKKYKGANFKIIIPLDKVDL